MGCSGMTLSIPLEGPSDRRQFVVPFWIDGCFAWLSVRDGAGALLENACS